MKITASLVLYNHKVSEVQDLVSVLSESVDSLFIIDNSRRVCIKKINQKNITYIHRPENLGFGGAHNIGINESVKLGSEIHFIVNPDIEVETGCIKTISEILANNSREIVAIMPQVLYPDGNVQKLVKRLPTPFDLFLRRFFPGIIKKLFARYIRKYECDDLNLCEPIEVPLLSGCFTAFQVKALENVGGFDSDFFMYLEDYDLFRRLRRYGKLVYWPKLKVIHGFQKGSYKSAKLLVYHLRSTIKYFNKWGWFFDKERKVINSQAGKLVCNKAASSEN